MAIGYLCPTYRVKPLSSLLVSVFVGSATMILSVWSAWMFFSAFLARRIMPPQVICHCDDCIERRRIEAEEAKEREENPIRPGPLASFMAFMGGSRRARPTPVPRDEEKADVDALGYREAPQPTRLSDVNKHISYASTATAGAKQL
ncbi:unnamed protein product [Rhizoctonia solani]|uniref:Uncharacterized protein n=1 Tax=Rhizoctonia solani TaxID=456999 RepID=A0A8H2Y2N1_9AGAM|nr:unnamed protein product [Rhizoctonia solani]